MDANIERAIKDAIENAPPMFNPVHERSELAWCPGNEAGITATIISNTWEDILYLCELYNFLCIIKDKYGKRLIFKYVIVELKSIIDQLDKLQGIIFLIIKRDSKDKPNGYISDEQTEKIRILFKEYHCIKSKVEQDILGIRNNIGAHRGSHPWKDIMSHWDKLEPNNFQELLSFIPVLFNFIFKLDIYDWIRSCDDAGTIELVSSGLKKFQF